jgi:hypothetical protein
MTCKVMSYKGKCSAGASQFCEMEVTQTDPGFKGDTATK